MCTYSMIIDYEKKRWSEPTSPLYPYTTPNAVPMPSYYPPYIPGIGPNTNIPGVSHNEFNRLKVELEELKKLLIAAKIFDEKTGQPHCEAEDKVELLKRVAAALGVDIKDAL
jgi:hypothetical protein